jgi:hypothetical protein
MPVIGFRSTTTAADSVYRVSAFRDGVKEAGLIDGHNVAIEFRWAENKLDRLPALAADLAQRQVAVIVGPNVSMRAARAATSTIPIVFLSGGDPERQQRRDDRARASPENKVELLMQWALHHALDLTQHSERMPQEPRQRIRNGCDDVRFD